MAKSPMDYPHSYGSQTNQILIDILNELERIANALEAQNSCCGDNCDSEDTFTYKGRSVEPLADNTD